MRESYKEAFRTQRRHAVKRGISWELSFDEWLAWWGDDIARRGSGPNDLQMQRPGDAGPYALWNIRKGTPRQNAKTNSAVQRNAAARRADEERQRRQDALMSFDSAPDYDDDPEDEMLDGQYLVSNFPDASDIASRSKAIINF